MTPALPLALALGLAAADPPASTSAVEGPAEPSSEAPADPKPPTPRLRLAHGLAGAAIPLFVTGSGIAVHASSEIDETLNRNVRLCVGAAAQECRDALVGDFELRAVGLGLIGGSIGLAAAALTADLEAPRRAWLIELGIGAGLAAGGVVWLGVNTAQTNAVFHDTGVTEADWTGMRDSLGSLPHQRSAATLFVGAGAGLLVGSIAGLLVERARTRRARLTLRPSLTWREGLMSLSLRGRV
ncbi:MAG: hypothetical protein R3A51_16135 [Nannocystaceae bacterium]